jgi:hypothetical protein
VPKRTKGGTHDYHASISVIDASLDSPSSNIVLGWYMSSATGLNLSLKVGDIIRGEKIRVQEFNNFPQLVGNEHKSSLTILHKKECYITGLPLNSSQDVSTGTAPLPIDRVTGDPAQNQHLNPYKRALFVDSNWTYCTLGVDPNVLNRPKHHKNSIDPNQRVKASWSLLLAPREVEIICYAREYSHDLFSRMSLMDVNQGVYHATLHNVQLFMQEADGLTHYASLLPAAEPTSVNTAGTGAGSGAADLSGGKCDVVCLVMQIIPPPLLGGDGLARMAVWDGTTNGSYDVHADMAKVINSAMQAPAIYQAAYEHQQQLRQQMRQNPHPHDPAVQEALQAAAAGIAAKLEADLRALESVEEPVRRYMGSAVWVTACDPSMNHQLLRLKPGMWIRMRNLQINVVSSPSTATAGARAPSVVHRAVVRPETQVCLLSPAYR